jgi:hypothetical protein
MPDYRPAVEHILQFFTWSHLPEHLAKVSRPFGELALEVASRKPESPETETALRKLLEAKDAAVRATLGTVGSRGKQGEVMKDEITPERLARLPKWAREHIEWQSAKLKYLYEVNDGLRMEKPTDVILEPYSSLGAKFLPNGGMIRFCFGERRTIDVSMRNGELHLNASPMLAVVPQASNAVRAFPVEFAFSSPDHGDKLREES